VVQGQTAARWAAKLLPVLRELHEDDAVSPDNLAAGLNKRGIPVRGGGPWAAEQVASVLRALGPEAVGKKRE